MLEPVNRAEKVIFESSFSLSLLFMQILHSPTYSKLFILTQLIRVAFRLNLKLLSEQVKQKDLLILSEVVLDRLSHLQVFN